MTAKGHRIDWRARAEHFQAQRDKAIEDWRKCGAKLEEFARKLDKIRKLCNERHEHGDVEGFGKCSVSGFCAILKIIDPPSREDSASSKTSSGGS